VGEEKQERERRNSDRRQSNEPGFKGDDRRKGERRTQPSS
jgi:hypothetical protein